MLTACHTEGNGVKTIKTDNIVIDKSNFPCVIFQKRSDIYFEITERREQMSDILPFVHRVQAPEGHYQILS